MRRGHLPPLRVAFGAFLPRRAFGPSCLGGLSGASSLGEAFRGPPRPPDLSRPPLPPPTPPRPRHPRRDDAAGGPGSFMLVFRLSSRGGEGREGSALIPSWCWGPLCPRPTWMAHARPARAPARAVAFSRALLAPQTQTAQKGQKGHAELAVGNSHVGKVGPGSRPEAHASPRGPENAAGAETRWPALARVSKRRGRAPAGVRKEATPCAGCAHVGVSPEVSRRSRSSRHLRRWRTPRCRGRAKTGKPWRGGAASGTAERPGGGGAGSSAAKSLAREGNSLRPEASSSAENQAGSSDEGTAL